MPEKYREGVREKIARYLPTMDSTDEKKLTSWNMTEVIESERVIKQSKHLFEGMSTKLRPRR